jgi:hypothetical protein
MLIASAGEVTERLRVLREEGVSFQRLKTWKASKGPEYAAKKARIEHLHAIADRDGQARPLRRRDTGESWHTSTFAVMRRGLPRPGG